MLNEKWHLKCAHVPISAQRERIASAMALRQRGAGLARQLRGGCSALVGQGVPALSQGVPSTCFAAEEAFPCVPPLQSSATSG